MLEHVKQQQAACDKDPACEQQASTLRGKVQVVGQLLERDPYRAVSRVTTHGIGATPERHIIKVERDGQIWKTTSREVDDGTFKPAYRLWAPTVIPGCTPDTDARCRRSAIGRGLVGGFDLNGDGKEDLGVLRDRGFELFLGRGAEDARRRAS